MRRRTLLSLSALLATPAVVSGALPGAAAEMAADEALARSLAGDFTHRYAEVNGTRLHYVIGGDGPPLVLLPGWPQTWWAYHKIMPALAARYRVIAVDLRGMGRSAKPPSGYDKKTMAADIHALTGHLGYRRTAVAGHDIGAMVAHSFAINFAPATVRLALLDVLHPDETMYRIPIVPAPNLFHPWWWAFNQVPGLPEQLVAGRSRFLVDTMIDQLAADRTAVSERDRQIYAWAYARPEAIRAGNRWYQAFGQDIADRRRYGKITVPVLGLSSEGNYEYLRQALPAVADDAQLVKVHGSGHYLAEERPAQVSRAMTDFFG